MIISYPDPEESAVGARFPTLRSIRILRVAQLGRDKVSLAIQGSAWVVFGIGASKLVRALTTLILARVFLGPKEFGLFALVTAFMSGANMLADLGIMTSVIRHPRGDEPRFLNTAFMIQAVRGIVVSGAAIALAYPFASFYRQPALLWLIIFAVLDVTIRGFTGVSVWMLSRNVQTRDLSFLTLYGDLAALVVSLTWAALSPNVWALVGGKVASALTYVIASHRVPGASSKFHWDRGAARDILSFGAGLLASSATFFLVTEGQRLVLAKFASVAELGCLALAMSISTLPAQFVDTVVERVFYPMISSTAAENVNRAAIHYKTVRPFILALSCCMGLGFVLCSGAITRLVLGPQYQPVAWMLPWLGARAALMLFFSLTSYMLFALGFTRYAAIGNITRLVYLGGGLTAAFHWFSFRQAVWVISLSPIFGYLPLLVGLKKHLRPALRTECACAMVLLGAAVMVGGVLYLSKLA